MEPFSSKSIGFASSVATLLAVRAARRRTLTPLGSLAGFFVGFCLCVTGLRGMVLVFFYQLGSWATKYKKQVKAQVDATVEGHSIRGARQVLAVSIVATVLSLYHVCVLGEERSIHFKSHPEASRLASAVLAHHATSLADTWASELGMALSIGRCGGSSTATSGVVVLITNPWRRVPAGTNGGITLIGTVCSVAGGLVIAALTLAMDVASGIFVIQPLRILAYGATCGCLGSLLDSVLGATLQITYFDERTKKVISQPSVDTKHVCGCDILTNAQVNLVSTIITTALGGWVLAPALLE